MSNSQNIPHIDFYQSTVNDKNFDISAKQSLENWLNIHKSEETLNKSIESILFKARSTFFNRNKAYSQLKDDTYFRAILPVYIDLIKNLYIDRMYRKKGDMQLIYNIRFCELACNKNTLAISTSKVFAPHRAVMLRKVDQLVVCTTVNLDSNNHIHSTYGVQALDRYLDEVANLLK